MQTLFYKSVDDLYLPNGLSIYVKDHDCHDHIEKLYYACEYEPCCIQCGEYLNSVEEDEDIYPQCDSCEEPPIKKRVANS